MLLKQDNIIVSKDVIPRLILNKLDKPYSASWIDKDKVKSNALNLNGKQLNSGKYDSYFYTTEM